LLKRHVLLESLAAVEQVSPDMKPKVQGGKEVSRVQITISEQTIPSNSLSKSV
jgi:hypothetical protein